MSETHQLCPYKVCTLVGRDREWNASTEVHQKVMCTIEKVEEDKSIMSGLTKVAVAVSKEGVKRQE